jgi:uncharacterized Zn finger protein (UPF0148 family)
MRLCEQCGGCLPRRSHGNRRYCDACGRERVRERNREADRERDRRRYHSDPEYRDKQNARKRRRYHSDPEYRLRKITLTLARQGAEAVAKREAMAIDPTEIARRIERDEIVRALGVA